VGPPLGLAGLVGALPSWPTPGTRARHDSRWYNSSPVSARPRDGASLDRRRLRRSGRSFPSGVAARQRTCNLGSEWLEHSGEGRRRPVAGRHHDEHPPPALPPTFLPGKSYGGRRRERGRPRSAHDPPGSTICCCCGLQPRAAWRPTRMSCARGVRAGQEAESRQTLWQPRPSGRWPASCGGLLYGPATRVVMFPMSSRALGTPPPARSLARLPRNDVVDAIFALAQRHRVCQVATRRAISNADLPFAASSSCRTPAPTSRARRPVASTTSSMPSQEVQARRGKRKKDARRKGALGHCSK